VERFSFCAIRRCETALRSMAKVLLRNVSDKGLIQKYSETPFS
jgi:hypothetical protein